MNIRSFFYFVLVLTLSVSAFARKPAVEDFVGVETESYSATSPGTEVLYDFSQKLPVKGEVTISPFFSLLTLASLILFPFMMWSGLTRKQSLQRQSIKTKNIIRITNSVQEQSMDNIEYLENYQGSKEDHKKAS